jgi:hypothetical protein
MRSGVILLAPSDSKEGDRLFADLLAKGITLIRVTLDNLEATSRMIRHFIADNNLESVVVSSLVTHPAEPLQGLSKKLELDDLQ